MLTHQIVSRTPKDIKKLFEDATNWYIENIDFLPDDVKDAFKCIQCLWVDNVPIRHIFICSSAWIQTISNYTVDIRWSAYVNAISDYYTLTNENSGPKGATA